MKLSQFQLANIAIASIIISFTGISKAAPEIEHVQVQREAGKQTLTIDGQGFGTKEHSAPILWVFGDDVRLNGHKSNLEENINIGDEVPTGQGPNDSIWESGSALFSAETRYPELTHTYWAGGNGWLGWPYAHGGRDTNPSTQAYVSWRVKPIGDINRFKVSSFHSLSGEFDTGDNEFTPGESITISSSEQTYKGRIVHIDETKSRVHLEGGGTRSTMHDAKITGDKSGAKLILDSNELFRTTTASKYFRSYESTRQGARAVYSTNRWISVSKDKNWNEIDRAFEKPDGSDAGYGVGDLSDHQTWNLVEAYIDLRGDTGDGYLNLNNNVKKWFKDLEISGISDEDIGPTISNIGWEGAGDTKIINASLNFGEIYFDKTPQRIVFSDKKRLSSLGQEQEIQYINEWTNNRVITNIRLGKLDGSKTLYIYIFDKNDNANKKGYPVCIRCDTEPPEKIKIEVK